MIILNKLNDFDYVNAKIKAFIIARRNANDNLQKILNIYLDILYDAKYNLLKKLYN